MRKRPTCRATTPDGPVSCERSLLTPRKPRLDRKQKFRYLRLSKGFQSNLWTASPSTSRPIRRDSRNVNRCRCGFSQLFWLCSYSL